MDGADATCALSRVSGAARSADLGMDFRLRRDAKTGVLQPSGSFGFDKEYAPALSNRSYLTEGAPVLRTAKLLDPQRKLLR